MSNGESASEERDPGAWAEFPVVVEFHRQWWRARGGQIGVAKLPFSRDWEQLIEAAGLTAAEVRAEAERDVRTLARAGLLQIKAVPRRPHFIGRIHLPPTAELRFARLFNDPLEVEDNRFDWDGTDWEPELRFVISQRVHVAPSELLAINRFLQQGGRLRQPVPIKERSIDLFGDEKRLDALVATSIFGDGRLSLQTLRAVTVPEPLAWRKGRGNSEAVLVIENAATWDSFSRWNQSIEGDSDQTPYAAVIYGGGHRFIDGVPYLLEIAAEIGPIRRIDYFGDLDPEGLRIPVAAGKRCDALGLPLPLPLGWAYDFLLAHGGRGACVGQVFDHEVINWLSANSRIPAGELFSCGQRIAQEWLGVEALQTLQPTRSQH